MVVELKCRVSGTPEARAQSQDAMRVDGLVQRVMPVSFCMSAEL